MDKTSWITGIVCVPLLCLTIYYQQSNSTKPQETQTAQTAPAASTQPTATVAPVAQATQGGVQAPQTIAPDPTLNAYNEALQEDQKNPITLTLHRDIDGKATPYITYNFTRVGGALGSVTLHQDTLDSQKTGDKTVTLNEAQEKGIGNFVFNMGPGARQQFDDAVYTVSASTADSVTLKATYPDRTVEKTYSFHPVKNNDGALLDGSNYLIRLGVKITNNTPNNLLISDWGLFAGSAYPTSTNETNDAYTYLFYYNDGLETQQPGYFTEGFFSKAKDSLFEGSLSELSYAGVMSQYYATVVIPDKDSAGQAVYASRQEFALKHEGDKKVPGVNLSLGMPQATLAPGATREFSYDIYTGPKRNEDLRDLSMTYPNLSDIMQYGWLTFLSVPMNWLLNIFHDWFGNWGIAIICMTIVVRVLIWPLYKKSYMSMKRMSLVQPEMAKLKEKYPDDPQKVNMEMMKLYQKYGINPAGGCLPMLIQIPIFFAFYRVLMYAAELRGEPFCLWMTDLSLPDTVGHIFGLPINILPLLMAATMILQMKLTPQAGEKSQRMIMNLMPLIFFFFCYNFASALALYWTTQNIISIGQTYLIRRMPLPALTPKKKKKPGFMQRMMEQQRLAMEQQQQAQGNKRNVRNVTPKR